MFHHGDPILKKNTEKIRKKEKENPNRDWKFGLSKERVQEMSIFMKIK